MTKPTVHVIGAGISGLRCAETLLENDIDVRIIEATDSIGGRMKTTRKDGFLLDHGFHVMQTGYPHSKSEIDFKALGAKRFTPGAIIIRSNGGRIQQHVLSDPFRKPISSLSALFSQKWSDLIRIAKLRISLGRKDVDQIFEGDDGTTEAFLRREGFSESFIDGFLRPLFSGIFLESKLETSERMFKFVFASMARGDMVLPRDGIQAYPNMIADRIGRHRIELSTTASAIDPNRLTLNGEEVRTDQVVVAHAGKQHMNQMKSVWTLYLSAPDSSIKGSYILLNGDYELGRNTIAHIAVPSNVQTTYSPEGRSLVALTIVGDASSALGLDSVEAIEKQARSELTALFDGTEDWETLEIFHTKNALPPNDHRSDTSNKTRFEEKEVITCGDHMTHGSLEGAIRSADHAVNEVIRRLELNK